MEQVFTLGSLFDGFGACSPLAGYSPTGAPGLLLRGDGYETKFYMKD